MSTQADIPRKTDDWDKHWTEHAVMNALNPAQVYRKKLVFELLALESAASPVRIVELGCGTGELARDVLAVRPDAEFVGLDLSDAGVEMARKKVPGARFFQQDFTKPMKIGAEYQGWATHAVCSEVLEHLDDPTAVLKNARALFAPGCKLVITVPAGPMTAFDKHIGHRRHFTPDRLADVLRDAGLNPDEVRGAGFPFFNLYRLTVLARGKKLIEDVANQEETTLPLSARAAIRVFSLLFKLNTSHTRLGWQLAAIGVEPR